MTECHDLHECFAIHPQYGFLPTNNLCGQLAPIADLNIQLNQIALHLPSLLTANRLRSEVEKLNHEYANAETLLENQTGPEINLATLIILMIAQGYIWENPELPMHSLPPVIARNLYSLCRTKQRFPTLTYADYVLYNWKLKNAAQNIHLNTVAPILTFTGTSDEAWFIKIHIAIEAISGQALYAAHQASLLAHDMWYSSHANASVLKLCALLHDIAHSLHNASSILPKMKEGCDVNFYWTTLRHYLNGWEKIKSTHQNVGVRFDGVLIRNKPPIYQYKGATGAQSSIIPALDAALGIKHEIDDMYQILLTFQQYMPRKHVLFIHWCHQSKIKDIVSSIHSKELTHAWENAVEQLGLFRLSHLQLVKEYIYQPAENAGVHSSTVTGTGGTLISDYLNHRYETTMRSA